MANPVESVGEALADRFRSPFLGTYAITSFVYHWPAWAYFFESTPADLKAARLAPLLGTPSAFLAPAALALVIVLTAPFLHWGIAWVVTSPKRRLLAIDADLERDKLLGLKAAAQIERAAAAEALDTLHQEHRRWDASKELRDLGTKEAEEQLRRLTEANEAHRLMIEKAEVERRVIEAQLEELKIARSEALGQRDGLLSHAKRLRKGIRAAQSPVEALLSSRPQDPEHIRALWVQVRTAFNGIEEAVNSQDS